RSARHHARRVDRPTPSAANDINGLRSKEGKVRTKTPPRVDRFERFLVAAVEAQCDSEIEMTESEVLVQLDSMTHVLYGGPDIARPKAGLGKHILGLRVFPIERCSPKSGFPSLTHKWSEVLNGAIVPLHNQGTSEP